jgi:hypothetical protein
MLSNANRRILQRIGTGLIVIGSAFLLGACGGGASTSGNPSATTAGASVTAAPVDGAGNAMVSWVPPQQNADGTALTDLAGFRIYYGTSADELTQVIDVNAPASTQFDVGNLSGGTWYFAVAALNSAGVEGDLSNVASKTIS